MLLPKLDERLTAAFEMTPSCQWAADIGTDHGRLPLHLLASGKVENMIVSDISAPALAKGQALLERYGFSNRAVCAVADGLNSLTRPVESVSILGMGGETIAMILKAGYERLGQAALVLSAHTELPRVRQALVEIGYHLVEERLCRAVGRLYVMLRALPGKADYTEKEIWLGPCLITQKPELWPDYLKWRMDVADTALARVKPEDPRGEALRRMRRYLEEEWEALP